MCTKYETTDVCPENHKTEQECNIACSKPTTDCWQCGDDLKCVEYKTTDTCTYSDEKECLKKTTCGNKTCWGCNIEKHTCSSISTKECTDGFYDTETGCKNECAQKKNCSNYNNNCNSKSMNECIENDGFFESKDKCDKIPKPSSLFKTYDIVDISSSIDGRYIAYTDKSNIYLCKYDNDHGYTTTLIGSNLSGNEKNKCFLSQDASILAFGIPLKNKIVVYNIKNLQQVTSQTITPLDEPDIINFGQQIYIDNKNNLLVKSNSTSYPVYYSMYKYTTEYKYTTLSNPYYTLDKEILQTDRNRNMISYEKPDGEHITLLGFNNINMYCITDAGGFISMDNTPNFYNISASTDLNVIATTGYKEYYFDISIYRNQNIIVTNEKIRIQSVKPSLGGYSQSSLVLSLSNDGNILLVSEYYDSFGVLTDSNNIWLCKYNNVSKSWTNKKISFPEAYESTSAISLSGDGRIAVIGFPKQKIIKIISTF
jgi:hypothetical protein